MMFIVHQRLVTQIETKQISSSTFCFTAAICAGSMSTEIKAKTSWQSLFRFLSQIPPKSHCIREKKLIPKSSKAHRVQFPDSLSPFQCATADFGWKTFWLLDWKANLNYRRGKKKKVARRPIWNFALASPAPHFDDQKEKFREALNWNCFFLSHSQWAPRLELMRSGDEYKIVMLTGMAFVSKLKLSFKRQTFQV